MSQSIPESVVSRVRKLLALAGNNSNENEAQAAAAKAQAILAEYNLEISQIGDAEPSADATREKDVGSVAATADWQVTLMAALAEANFCLHWTTETLARRMDGTGKLRMRRRHSLIGRQVNIIVVKEMYTYLLQAMERLCPYGDRRDRSTRSWYQGCSDRLRSRLQEQRAASEAESRKRRGETPRGSGTDLVLSDVYSSEEDLNNDLRYGYAPGTTAAHRAERDARWAAQRASYEAELAARHSTNPVAPEAKKQESERERLKREARDRRWYESYQRRQAREEAKVDRWAYNQGSSTGRDIGLDRQVEKSKAAQIG